MITLIAAMAENRAIGLDGGMPWHLPAELQHFKQTTMGRTIVMGRKTWESIGRPLPGRQNIVISRNMNFVATGAEITNSLKGAIAIAKTDEIMVIGGGQLYELAMPFAQRMVLTLIKVKPDADTWFPEWDATHWQIKKEQHYPADDSNALAYRIVELTRVASSDPTDF